jgi:16S rRNA (guanine966-N2)-methyltransferase
LDHPGKNRRRAAGNPRPPGQARVLRIIGGTWRGRKLRFPPSAEIRPTPDRVRETLFNWLGTRLPGARCLDLFAGSGALGLEALSRGAGHVTFVERDLAAVRELRARLSEWGTPATSAEVEHVDALRFLKGGPQDLARRVTGNSDRDAGKRFDIVFLDPPFDSDFLTAAAGLLEERQWLAPGALLYVECAARNEFPALPPTWVATKAKQAGEVGYHLLRRA